MRNKLALVTALTLFMTVSAKAQDSVEVLHWWTSGGEAAALNVLKDDLAKKGVQWNDMPVAGGGGEQAMTTARARVQSGNAPTAVQALGFDIIDWAKLGHLANLNAVADRDGWNKVVPSAIQRFSKHNGTWIAAPVNVHSTNWVWANKAIFDKLDIKQPKSWDELITALTKIQRAGYIPVAHGGQDWQDATVFEAIVLATGGPKFYKKALNDLDDAALRSATMRKSFDRLLVIRSFVDDNFSGRDWNLATAMVKGGKAGVQFMGDWAKGEFINDKLVPNEDFLCFRFPGTQGSVTFNSDQFIMFDSDNRAAQEKLASAILSPTFQIAFNVVKGSVPARSDISDAKFDGCAKKAMKDLKTANRNGNLYGSIAHGHGGPTAVKKAFLDVVTAVFNRQLDASSAPDELADAINVAK